MNSLRITRLQFYRYLDPDLLPCKRETLKGIFEMTGKLHQFYTEGQMSPEESRSIGLLTLLSKLVMALMMGLVAMIVLLIS